MDKNKHGEIAVVKYLPRDYASRDSLADVFRTVTDLRRRVLFTAAKWTAFQSLTQLRIPKQNRTFGNTSGYKKGSPMAILKKGWQYVVIIYLIVDMVMC